MKSSSFARAVAGACIATCVAVPAARGDDRPVDCADAGIVAPSATEPHVLSMEVPVDTAFQTGWIGSVALAFTVARDGTARDVRVEKSGGFAPVDKAVVDAIRDNWRYLPATKGGKPIRCEFRTLVLWGQKPAPAISKPVYTVVRVPASDYPDAIRTEKEEGIVGLMVFIDDDDKTVKAKVVVRSRFADLDAASLDYVTHRAHLAAAQVNGMPAKTVIYVDVEWSLAPPKILAPAGTGGDSMAAKLMISEVSPPCTAPAADAGPEKFEKRGAILLEHDATSPSPAQLDGIKLLADDIANAIAEGATAVQLRGYGGDAWDLSPQACKLSMDRANAIQQLLVDDGLKADKISVLAMGGSSDDMESDRVDVYVQTK